MLSQRYFDTDGDERESYLESLDEDELLDLGIELYEAGHYWNAHEAWEQVWLDAPRELRNFYQGLIQVTAAFVHVTRNEYPGSVRLLRSGIDKLESYTPSRLGIDVSTLVANAKRALTALEALGERRLSEFDRALIPRIEKRRVE